MKHGPFFYRVLVLWCCAWILPFGDRGQAAAAAEPTLHWAVTEPSDQAQPLQPLLPEPLDQAAFCRDPDGQHYLMGLSPASPGNDRDALSLWTSRNQLHWQELEVAGAIPRRLHYPELHWVGSTFWIVYGTAGGGIALLGSTSGRAQGPYEDLGMLLPAGRDPSLFVEESGKIYLVYSGHFFARLRPDGGGLADEPQAFQWQQRPPEGVGWRGPFVMKHRNRYLLFRSRSQVRLGTQTEDVYMAVADRLAGPYGPPVLTVPHAGQMTAWTDVQNKLWGSFNPPAQDTMAVFTQRVGCVPLVSPEPGFWRPRADVILERGVVAGLRPVLPDLALRDVCICSGPDGTYYLTGVGPDCHYDGEGIPLWQSRDLKQWDPMPDLWDWGDLFSLDWAPKDVEQVRVRYPRLTYERGARTFLLTLSLQKGETHRLYLYRSASGKPEDPYIPVSYQPISTGQTGLVLAEVGNTWYWVTETGGVARLKKDFSGLAEPMKKFQFAQPDQRVGDTLWVHKTREGYALVTSRRSDDALGDESYDLWACRSARLLGPYSPWQLVVPHGGGGMAFADRDRIWRVAFSGYDATAPFRDRLGLVPITVHYDGTVEPVAPR